MNIHRTATEVVVQTPAKLNLFFEVLARRNDGYHEIETLMCPIDLFDTLHFQEESSGHLELTCQWAIEPGKSNGVEPRDTSDRALPASSDNLVVRAVELLRRHASVSLGATMRLAKRIPCAAGLGGGSSDAAAALVAANEGWNLGLPEDELSSLAAEIGSDVPFFLAGGAAICRGRGERISPVADMGGLHFVVVRPPAGLATADVYAACRPAEEPKTINPLMEALAARDTRETGRLLFNRLQEAAESLSPWISRLGDRFGAEDVLGHGMSGSGTSYYGLCRHASHARRVARRFQACSVGSVFAVRSCC